MLGEAAQDPNVAYDVQKFTYTFDGVELCGRGAIRYIGWGQISKAWGQISAAQPCFVARYRYGTESLSFNLFIAAKALCKVTVAFSSEGGRRDPPSALTC